MADGRPKGKPLWWQAFVVAGFGVFFIALGYWALDPQWHLVVHVGPRKLLYDILNTLPPLIRGWGMMAIGAILIGGAVQLVRRQAAKSGTARH